MGSSSSPKREQVEPYISTRRFYDQNAENYAEATLPLSMEQLLEPFAARLQRGGRIVDLGCGAGRDLRAFLVRGLRPIGLDVSYQLARLAKAYSGCPVVVGDLRMLPFATDSFSGVWASASLLHLRRDDVRMTLAEIRRILQPGGHFFSSMKCGHGEGADSKGRWFSYFQPADWLSQLKEAGWDIVDSHASSQASGTLERDQSIAWFNCTARRIE